MTRRRTTGPATVILCLLLAWVGGGHAPATAGPAYPSSMSSLGDSITRGFNASGWFTDWPSRSWSTGRKATVRSHYTRLLEVNPAISGRAWNNARTGAKVSALASQAGASVSQGAEYVTILVGANDACTSTEDRMTSVGAFATRFRAGLEVLATQAPHPRVLVASIPDLRRLWRVGRDSVAARTAWATYGICRSMLARPRSTDRADVDRRARVRHRVMDYNATLAAVCAEYPFCRYDQGTVFDYPFTLGQLSRWDYFHPNRSGQAVLAALTWRVGFWSTTAAAPR